MFKLKVFEIVDDSKYPIKLKQVLLGKFKYLVDAQEQMMQHVLSKNKVYEYVIDEFKNRHWHNAFYHDSKGLFKGMLSTYDDQIEFTPRPIKYPVGTLVEVREWDEVQLGIVCATPFTEEELKAYKEKRPGIKIYEDDNVYLINYDSNHDHSHPTELRIRYPSIKNLPEDKVADLKKSISSI